ncbi:MAG: hypothetical protein HY867_20650 [Chloroflexi bacterium]|nr:hypothetical protein [Chloroflexota bacterium]
MLNISSLNNVQNLSAYVLAILNKLEPILERLDAAKLDDSSEVEISNERGDWVLRLAIVPADVNIPLLSLSASSQYCILAFAEGEQIECHSNPEADESLVDMVVESSEKYLGGITVIESYNRNGKLIRKECFFGMDAGNDEKSKIGTSSYFLVFPKKVYSTKKKTFRFLK